MNECICDQMPDRFWQFLDVLSVGSYSPNNLELFDVSIELVTSCVVDSDLFLVEDTLQIPSQQKTCSSVDYGCGQTGTHKNANILRKEPC
jgi:hypothetical protein